MKKRSECEKSKDNETKKRCSFREYIKKIKWKKAVSWITRIPWKAVRRVCRGVMSRAVAVCCFLLCLCVLLFVGVFSVSGAVCDKTQDRILTEDQLKSVGGDFDYILVLGCGLQANGEPSHMLYDRIETAVALYRAGICEKLLMSGDNREEEYNEVGAMRETAMEMGVPEEAIITDPAGLSTYDSVVRLLEVYKGKRVVIVTQKYHLYRALYIAEKLGIEAYGVGADPRTYSGQIKRDVREVFARCKDVCYALIQPPFAEVKN